MSSMPAWQNSQVFANMRAELADTLTKINQGQADFMDQVGVRYAKAETDLYNVTQEAKNKFQEVDRLCMPYDRG